MANDLETSRLKLHEEFETKLGIGNRYFQPPESIKLKYPAVVYDLYRLNQRFANDAPYRKLPCYSVSIITRSADIDYISKMLDSFRYCSLERVYVADNLQHYNFILYYL